MAFQTAAAYGNLSQGNFSPVIYSKKAQLQFRKVSVAQDVTNTEYFGEISSMGDTVNIIQEPTLTVSAYSRGQDINIQDLDDDQIQLVVDQANAYAFKVDDIERKHAHHNWESMASSQAAYRLRDAFDTNIFTYMKSNLTTALTIGTTGSPTPVNYDGAAGDFSPTQLLNRLGRLLDEGNVPSEGRWAVVDPFFLELMRDDSSKLINNDYSEKGALSNGMVTNRPVQGFKLYASNNLPSVGTGPSATSGTNYGWLLAGHTSAVATAEQIMTSEKIRAESTFADIIRGLHVFGRGLLRSESLVASIYNNAT